MSNPLSALITADALQNISPTIQATMNALEKHMTQDASVAHGGLSARVRDTFDANGNRVGRNQILCNVGGTTWAIPCDPSPIGPPKAPVITVQPQDFYIYDGQGTAFAGVNPGALQTSIFCGSGDLPMTFSWQFQDQNGNWNTFAVYNNSGMTPTNWLLAAGFIGSSPTEAIATPRFVPTAPFYAPGGIGLVISPDNIPNVTYIYTPNALTVFWGQTVDTDIGPTFLLRCVVSNAGGSAISRNVQVAIYRDHG